jgi:hypothetical protein
MNVFLGEAEWNVEWIKAGALYQKVRNKGSCAPGTLTLHDLFTVLLCVCVVAFFNGIF